MAIGLKFLRKYGAVVFFPTFTVLTIYADWSHTQKWKKGLLLEKTQKEELQS